MPSHSKRKQKNQAQHLMFIASATAFIISTIYEAAQLGGAGILIHAGLVGYPGLSQAEKRPLINGQLTTPNIILQWTSVFEV